ncbi:MAG: DNA polymerase III subunit gamma and tau, partial [Pseudolysinimonas sp.]
QTGQDPRRFVEDLLERLRDLIVVAATRDAAASVMRGGPQDELDHMAAQAQAFGAAELSRAADVVNTALTEMTGATSPRLHLELMVARLLVPAADDSDRGALARVERLERRIGVSDEVGAAPGAESRRAVSPSESSGEVRRREAAAPADPPREVRPVETSAGSPAAPDAVQADVALKPVSASQLRDAWPEVLEVMQKAHGRRPWSVVATTTVHAFDGEVLTLQFSNESDVASFRPGPGSKPGESVSEQLRAAILEVLGVRVKFLPRVEAPVPAPAELPEQEAPTRSGSRPAPEPEPEPELEPEPVPEATKPESSDAGPNAAEPATAGSGWNVAVIPGAAAQPPAADPAPTPVSAASAGPSRYGEAVVRELLNASFIEETSLAPRDRPVPLPEEQ